MLNKNEEVIVFLESKLNEFIYKELPNFSLTNKEVYSKDVVYGSESSDNGLNPYFKYEADVKVKLGWYLNYKIFKKNGYKQYTVNSEMPYKYLTNLNSISTQTRIDLSLHRINQKGNILWINRKLSVNSLIAGIEIKLLNYKEPDYNIGDEMKKDINKLQVLKKC